MITYMLYGKIISTVDAIFNAVAVFQQNLLVGFINIMV